jgi:hypothetical protein
MKMKKLKEKKRKEKKTSLKNHRELNGKVIKTINTT